MHRTKKVTIICYSIAAILLILISIFCFLSATGRITYGSFTIGGLFNGMSIGSIERLSGDFEERGSYKISGEELQSLDIQWEAGAVEVVPFDGEDIYLTEYVQRDISEKEQVSYRMENGCLKIRYTEEYFGKKLLTVISSTPEKKFLVQIPESLAEKMKDISITSTGANILVEGFTGETCSLESYSGSIDAENMSFDDFTADTTSGNMNLSDINTDSFTIESYSGGLSFGNVVCNKLRASSTSGNIELSDTEAESASIDSYSGKISINGFSADRAVFDTTSGNVIISDLALSSLSVSTYSGDTELENVTCNTLKTDSTSGKLTVYSSEISKSNISTYSGKVVMDGYFDEIEADSMSGDVSVTSEVCPRKFNVDSYSGNVSLSIPETKGISAEFDSLSGKFDSGVFNVAVSAGDYKLTVSTTSGDFYLKKIG